MATYSDTTTDVLALAFERLRGKIPEKVLRQLELQAKEGRLDDIAAVRAVLAAEPTDAGDR